MPMAGLAGFELCWGGVSSWPVEVAKVVRAQAGGGGGWMSISVRRLSLGVRAVVRVGSRVAVCTRSSSWVQKERDVVNMNGKGW